MHLTHKWDKWERYMLSYNDGGVYCERQRRVCIVCGKTQDELVWI